MGLSINTRAALGKLYDKHPTEFGKIIQKILALALKDLGYQLVEERTVQGVDIDIIHTTTGEKKAIEVKTCLHREVSIGPKDTDGLSRRTGDGYRSYLAILSLPLSVSLGWLVVPADGFEAGRYGVLSLNSRRDGKFSEAVNQVFERRFEAMADELLGCEKGTALSFLKQVYGI